MALSLFVLFIFLLFGFYFCTFEVKEGELAYFASRSDVLYSPGLHLKWPQKKIQVLSLMPTAYTFTLPLQVRQIPYTVSWTIVAEVNHPQSYLLAQAPDIMSGLQLSVTELLKSEPPALSLSSNLITDLHSKAFKTLQKNTQLNAMGLHVSDVWITKIAVSEDQQKSVYATMQEKAESIAKEMKIKGEKDALAFHQAVQKEFLLAEVKALNAVLLMKAEASRQAAALLSLDYQKNPLFFKAYLKAKEQNFNQAYS